MCPVQLECSEEKQYQWEILFKPQDICKPKIKPYSLPIWAGTWKIMNFAFRQQKPKWDCVWPDYEQTLSDKSEKVQQLEEEVGTSTIIRFGFYFHVL